VVRVSSQLRLANLAEDVQAIMAQREFLIDNLLVRVHHID
jgi:hypothetical protein